jgi:hypothetical protein
MSAFHADDRVFRIPIGASTLLVRIPNVQNTRFHTVLMNLSDSEEPRQVLPNSELHILGFLTVMRGICCGKMRSVIQGAGVFFLFAMMLQIILSGSFSRIFFRSFVQSPLPVS